MSTLRTNEIKDLAGNTLIKQGEVLATTVNTVADLASAEHKAGSIQLLGFHTKGDGGGGVFYWDATKDKSEHNGGTVIDPDKAGLVANWASTQNLYFTPEVTGQGCWVREYSGAVNVKWFGAVGDGVSDDITGLTNADKSASLTSRSLYIPKGVYVVSKPFVVSYKNSLYGDSQDSTIIKKTNNVTHEGIDAVIFFEGGATNRATVENIGTWGNRVSNVDPLLVTATSYGMYFDACTYMTIKHVRNYKSLNGMYLRQCILINITEALSQQCQSYGFVTTNVSTSITFQTCTSWGCGGGWDIYQTYYSSLNGCACDASDLGGNPATTGLYQGFGAGENGGNWKDPNFVYKLTSSQGITITSCGAESGYSQYLYSEGGFASILNPYVIGLLGAATDYKFCGLRQNGDSSVEIINPIFINCNNTLGINSNIKGFYVQTPSVQKLRLSYYVPLGGDTFGAYQYSYDGIEFISSEAQIYANQSNMLIGVESPLIPDATGASTIINTSGVKEINLTSTSDNTYFVIPLPSKGTLKIRTRGVFSSAYGLLSMQIREVGGSVLKEYTSINTDSYFTVDSNLPLEFAIKKWKSSEVIKLSELSILKI
jgi:hypothetical protein